jgi:putative heme transporter
MDDDVDAGERALQDQSLMAHAQAAGTGGRNRSKRNRIVRVVQVVVSVVLIIAVFAYAIPKFAAYSTIWSFISVLTLTQVLLLIGATAFNIFTYWPQMTASLPGLTIAQAAVNNQSSTTVANTVPGGGFLANGVTWGMYRSWGFTRAEIGLSMLITAIWNSFIKLGLPIIAVAILAIQGSGNTKLLIPALVGLAALMGVVTLFALTLWKKALARRIGHGLTTAVSSLRRLFRKPPVQDWGEAAVGFRKRTIRLVTKRWIPLTISSVVSHIGLYVVLLISLRFVGVSNNEVGWAEVLGIFAFGRLLTALPLTPGGVGFVELAYIGGLVLAGRNHTTATPEAFRAQVTAGVLLFRALTYGAQIPLGGITYAIWRTKKSWRRAPRDADVAVPIPVG